jgi:hypothetical protein
MAVFRKVCDYFMVKTQKVCKIGDIIEVTKADGTYQNVEILSEPKWVDGSNYYEFENPQDKFWEEFIEFISTTKDSQAFFDRLTKYNNWKKTNKTPSRYKDRIKFAIEGVNYWGHRHQLEKLK